LKRVSNKAIIEAYVKTGIMIQFGCRACVEHFNNSGFLKQNSLSIFNIYQSLSINSLPKF
jgi:hypothetical protein